MVATGALSCRNPRGKSARFRGAGMSSVGGLTRYPVDYRPAFASSLIPSPPSRRLPLQSAFPRGEATGLLRSSRRSLRGRVVPFGRWRVIRDGDIATPIPGHVPFGPSLTASLARLCLRPFSALHLG